MNRIAVHTQHTRTEGFTLLLSVLVMSLVLTIGIAISSLTLKQLQLSSIARESQFAFYAADAGAECALFWDRKQEAFETGNARNTVSCLGSSWSVSHTATSDGAEHVFEIQFPQRDSCAIVRLKRQDTPIRRTQIESRGYNTCEANNPRRVERALRVTY